MEEEELNGPRQVSKSKVLVKDSQSDPFKNVSGIGLAELGMDFEPIAEEEGEKDAAPAEEQPTKVWKKKGLKRQTKRVHMKPRAKPKPISRGEDTDDDAVAETQAGGGAHEEATQNDDDYHDSADETAQEAAEGSKIGKLAPKKAKKAAQTEKKKADKPTKKQNPLAHANFRALKIKNKNSKAKGRGRFGRRGR